MPCSWGRCLPIMLDLSCGSNHFTTVSQTSKFMQVSPFSSTLRKGHLSWHSVFECLETSLLCWRQFGMRKIHRFSHAFPLTQNIFVNSTPILKLYSAWSCADAMFPSGNFGETSSVLSQSCTCKAQPKTNLHISVACVPYLKLVSVSSSPKSSGYSLEKLERPCLLLLGFPLVSLLFFFFFFFTNDKIQNFENLSVFPECLIDFHDFQECIQYSRNCRHVWERNDTPAVIGIYKS